MQISLPLMSGFIPLTREFIPSAQDVRVMSGLTRIDLRLPDELVEKTDILAKLEYKNRTDAIKSALTEYLGGISATSRRRKLWSRIWTINYRTTNLRW
uniref:Ribbon-helix-helix protein CopG domain-containing protein n=1 Tax=Candidatus Methanogaster sp. ANME-2c ERB4 TaxID=2759911 RepID=A0A7G9YLA5_9EURY|nr:hypothetical protein GZ1D1_28 [uncultured archaeon GZfos1D1]QNO48789.1 hypothetical protein BEOMFINI_00028 [Methanosarcinales archaeon ANME-2c ERB4]